MSGVPPLAPRRSRRAPAVPVTALTTRASWLEVAGAVALACVTLAAAPGTRGLIGRSRSLAPVLLAALAMHLLAWVLRRRFGPAGFLIALAGCPLLVSWLVYPGTTFLGVPSTRTFSEAGHGLRLALEALGTGLSPAIEEPAALQQGRLALAVACVALCALVADQAGFRMRQASLALVPSLTLVVLGATRAPLDQPGPALAAYLILTMSFLYLHHVALTADRAPRSGHLHVRLPGLAPAAGLCCTAVVSALVVAPLLPGYGRPPIVAATGSVLARQGEAARVSNLVDLNPTLVKHSDVLMFTVYSPVATYWRLTSLDTFDGTVWTQGPDHDAASDLDTGYVPGSPVVQDFQLEGLKSDWLPAAYRPLRVDGSAGYLVTGDSSTVGRREAATSGDRYRVASVIPQLSAPLLRQLRVPSPDPALRRYLALPSDLPPRVAEEADRVTRSARLQGAYATAFALQTYFRTGFTYNLGVGSSSDDDALVRFLFRTRQGYCEQFAAAFAVMARSVGLPARVAVGFTPGERRLDGRYEVRGLNAHAWPEVFLGGAGWVAFEPTPGRGMPGAEGYTGVRPAQARTVSPEDFPGPSPIASSTTTIATTPTAPTTPGRETTRLSSIPRSTTPTVTTAVPAPSAERRPANRRVLPVVAASAGVLLMIAVVPLAKGARRRSRRRQSADPSERVMVAWAEASEALASSGMRRRPSETLMDHAARTAENTRLPAQLAEPVLALAVRAGTASYAAGQLSAHDATESSEAAALIEEALRNAAPPHRRLSRALDPRPLWRREFPDASKR